MLPDICLWKCEAVGTDSRSSLQPLPNRGRAGEDVTRQTRAVKTQRACRLGQTADSDTSHS